MGSNVRVTDKEYADFLIFHIHNPCEEPKTGVNIRDFYIREARRSMEEFEDKDARRDLEFAISLYEF